MKEEQDGKILWQMTADSIDVDPDTKQARFHNVHGTFYQADGSTLELAGSAIAWTGKPAAALAQRGDVVRVRLDIDAQSDMTWVVVNDPIPSGATILGCLLFGASRTVAAEFTFFLAIPVMFGASALKMVKFGFHYTGAEILILVVGMVTAFIVSILSIKFLMRYIKTNDFKAFGWYRIALGIVVLAYLFLVGDPTAND